MYFKSNNIKIYYEKYGNTNKTILILPGWGDTRETFNQIINSFKDNYTIYILDYPGFGKSPIPKKTLTIYDYTEIIYNFLNKNKINNPLIIAHSFGGRITTLLTTKYKVKIDKMLLIDIAGIKPKKTLKQKIKETIYKTLKRIIKITKNKEKYQKKLIKIFASTDYQNLPNGMHQTFKNIINEDLTNYIKLIPSECLIIWGKQDTSTPLKDAYKIKKLIKNSALIVFPNGNHFPYLQYPYLINKIIYEFIKEKE